MSPRPREVSPGPETSSWDSGRRGPPGPQLQRRWGAPCTSARACPTPPAHHTSGRGRVSIVVGLRGGMAVSPCQDGNSGTEGDTGRAPGSLPLRVTGGLGGGSKPHPGGKGGTTMSTELIRPHAHVTPSCPHDTLRGGITHLTLQSGKLRVGRQPIAPRPPENMGPPSLTFASLPEPAGVPPVPPFPRRAPPAVPPQPT